MQYRIEMLTDNQRAGAAKTLQLFKVPPPYSEEELTKIVNAHAQISESLKDITVKRDGGHVNWGDLFFQAAETAARGRVNGCLLLEEMCNEIKAARSSLR